ncbi:MAG: hypothetical protein FWE54_01845 [Methanimicrococcus sp.]|nr:hypothetical protein [Methanimicrococcus sp.]
MGTQRILIATDVDRTVLTQTEAQEKYDFDSGVGHELIRLAENGFYVAFITGNSMEQLTNRLLRFLIEKLCHNGRPDLIGNFHFFCNAGGVYFHLDEQNPKIKRLAEQREQYGQSDFIREVMNDLTQSFEDGSLQVLPEFIDVGYLKRTCIPDEDAIIIKQILNEHADAYFSEINEKRAELGEVYDLSKLTADKKSDGPLVRPIVEGRPIRYMDNSNTNNSTNGNTTDNTNSNMNGNLQTGTVQLTLKPVLSYKHGRGYQLGMENTGSGNDEKINNLFKNDCRTSLVKKIQDELDRKGFGRYVARPGGNTSIDITFDKLDKAYALEFIIDRLNLQGQERLGQHVGSNTIYFGDEVIAGGGNDFPVTRIPGLLIFAVNHDVEKVPAVSKVLVPSLSIHEVKATETVLRKLNSIAEKQNFSNSALDAFKEELFKTRIIEKLNKADLKAQNWQTLNAFVSLMCREDESSKRWLEILVDELDSIMIHLGDNSKQPAYGTSHPPDD